MGCNLLVLCEDFGHDVLLRHEATQRVVAPAAAAVRKAGEVVGAVADGGEALGTLL